MPPARTLKVWSALGAVWVIWGSTYLAIRVMVETVPPLLGASVRWIFAGLVLYWVSIRRGDRSDVPTRAHWRSAAIIGTALCLGGNGIVAVAEKRVASGTAALLVATVPLWVAVFAWARYRARLSAAVIAGLVIGFAGTAVLVLPGGDTSVDAVGATLVLTAACIWAGGSLYSRRAPLPARPLVGASMEMICGGIACLVAAAAGGELGRLDLGAVSQSSALAIAYLAIFGSIIAFTSYVWSFRNVSTSLATTYAFVNPLIAVILGTIVADEVFTGTMLTGGAIIVVAVAVIVTATGGGVRSDDVPTQSERPDLAGEVI